MSILNSLINIDLAEQQDVFLFSNFEHDKKLHVILLDINKCKAFSGYATDIDLRSQAAAINMMFSDFLSLSAKALTKKEAEGNKFLYSLEKNCGKCIFKWKSVDHDETVISIGSIKVTEKDYGSLIKEVFIMLSDKLLELNSKVSSMENDLLSIRKEKEDAVKLASEITDIKDRVENELFSKFILVLNEKKKKIRKHKQDNNDSLRNAAVSKRKKTTESKKLHQISDSSDNDDISDLERASMAGPSTSKHNISLPFLDDANDERPLLPSPSKRRIRQNNSNVKKVASLEPKPKGNPKVVLESESEDELLLNL